MIGAAPFFFEVCTSVFWHVETLDFLFLLDFENTSCSPITGNPRVPV